MKIYLGYTAREVHRIEDFTTLKTKKKGTHNSFPISIIAGKSGALI